MYTLFDVVGMSLNRDRGVMTNDGESETRSCIWKKDEGFVWEDPHRSHGNANVKEDRSCEEGGP